MTSLIPFNRPRLSGKEMRHIQEALTRGHLAGVGSFTKKCEHLLEENLGETRVLLTNSCTSALEITALALGLGPGDEVIIPSYTFVSTANAFYKFGATPILCDIRASDLTLDVEKAAELISPRTKAIVPVHYAGVEGDSQALQRLCENNGITLIEDAAHCDVTASVHTGLGLKGAFSTFSFHETKNLTCGEGGALFVNDPQYVAAAEIIREKGTDRSRFLRGEVDKYSWVSAGSSYVLSDILAGFLYGQFEEAEAIRKERAEVFERYAPRLQRLEAMGYIEFPLSRQNHSVHMCYILLDSHETQQQLLAYFRDFGIHAVFHYVPLHTSKVGESLGYKAGDLPVSLDISERIVRLPFFCGLSEAEIDLVCHGIECFFSAERQTFSEFVEKFKVDAAAIEAPRLKQA